MHAYDEDILAWSQEQARLIRTGRFELPDLEHIAEAIEDVGKSEQRWLDVVWSKAVAQAVSETDLDCFPEVCPWAMDDEVSNPAWLPDV